MEKETRRAFSHWSKDKWVLKKRLTGGGKKNPVDQDLKEKVLNWVYDRLENMLRVSWKLIRKKGKTLSDESVRDDLCAKKYF